MSASVEELLAIVGGPMLRYELHRTRDDALIHAELVPTSHRFAWRPPPWFDPSYPHGYEWRILDMSGLELYRAEVEQ